MTTWQDLNNAMAGTIADVRQSLVQIRSDEGNIGAGTIWHEDGLVITNAHVILDRHRVRDNLTVVLPDDSLYDATVLSYDRERDIAALSIEGDTFPTIQVGNSDDIHAGQWAMALGHPWGVIDSLTSGIIIGRGNKLTRTWRWSRLAGTESEVTTRTFWWTSPRQCRQAHRYQHHDFGSRYWLCYPCE